MLPDSLYTEKELLIQVATGNEAAFRMLYEKYHHALYRNVIRLLHSTEEAEDVVQEVFITLWEKRSELNMERPIDGWLFTLSYNRTINYLKKKLRHKSIFDSVDDPVEQINEMDQIEAQWGILESAINQLSPQKRKVFELCKLNGKSYEKAAVELGISRYTVGEYLQDAMAFIREYVRNQPSHTSSVIALIVLEIFLR